MTANDPAKVQAMTLADELEALAAKATPRRWVSHPGKAGGEPYITTHGADHPSRGAFVVEEIATFRKYQGLFGGSRDEAQTNADLVVVLANNVDAIVKQLRAAEKTITAADALRDEVTGRDNEGCHYDGLLRDYDLPRAEWREANKEGA